MNLFADIRALVVAELEALMRRRLGDAGDRRVFPAVEHGVHVTYCLVTDGDAADDLDVALALSADASRACNRKIEVRPFDGIA